MHSERSEFEDGESPADIKNEEPISVGVQRLDLFTPEHTILNVDCQMVTGAKSASSVALLTLATQDGASFSVLDETGQLSGGKLDFRPNHLRIGRRADGSVLYGVGDLRLNSKFFRPRDSDEPVRIYHDSHLIYESDKAWDFGISHDGSSFFVHQPSSGGTSRLIVRNLKDGTQVEYELDSSLTPVSDYSMEYASGYSMDGSEVVFKPAHADAMGRGVYWFYPVGEGRARRITVEGMWAALLTSSEHGYFVDYPDDLDPHDVGSEWKVTRRRLDPSRGDAEELWSSRLTVRHYGGGLSLSENGKWLGLSGWDYKVLETESGETIFDFPYSGKPQARLNRLTPVLAEAASVTDMGSLGHMGFKGNFLVGYRTVGDASSCSKKHGEKWDRVKERKCLRDLRLRGLYRSFFDIYNMSSIELNGTPSYSIEVYPESNCRPASSGWKGLVELDGSLGFKAVPDIENVDVPES